MNTVGYHVETPESAGVVADAIIGEGMPRILDYSAAGFNHSWLVRIGEDRNRSYFTYYSEFNRSSPGIVYVEIFFLLLLTLVSIFGNALIAYVVLSNQKIKKYNSNANLFIANMCVADILFTLTNPVIGIVRYQESWKLGASCGILQYIQIACGVVLIWSMALISMDRFRRVVNKLYTHLTELVAKISIAICWVLALGFAVPIYVYFKVEEFDFGADKVKICTLMWPKGPFVRVSEVYVTILVLVFFIIPFVIIFINYVTLFITLWKTRNTMIKWTGRLSRRRNQQDIRVTLNFALAVLIFTLMWLPMSILFLLVLRDGITEAMRTSSWAFLLAFCIASANACVNPIIYGLFNRYNRQSIMEHFRRLQGGTTQEEPSTSSVVPCSPVDKDNPAAPSSSSGLGTDISCGTTESAVVNPLVDKDNTATSGPSGLRKDSYCTITETVKDSETHL